MSDALWMVWMQHAHLPAMFSNLTRTHRTSTWKFIELSFFSVLSYCQSVSESYRNTHQVSTKKKSSKGRLSEVGGKPCAAFATVEFSEFPPWPSVNLTSSVWPHGGSRFVPERRGRLAGHGRTLQVINKQTKRWRGIHCFQPIL